MKNPRGGFAARPGSGKLLSMDAMDPELANAIDGATGVLFLCSGNVMRSAFADVYARHRGCRLPVFSAATTYVSEALHPETESALREAGVSGRTIKAFRPDFLSYVQDQLEPDWVVFGMTHEHVSAMGMHRDLASRTFLLTRLTGDTDEIVDPMFHGPSMNTWLTIRACVDALIERTGVREDYQSGPWRAGAEETTL